MMQQRRNAINSIVTSFTAALIIGSGCISVVQADAPIPVGHRGIFRHAPENTLPSFAACLELGMGFELDIRTTQDFHLVVLHANDHLARHCILKPLSSSKMQKVILPDGSPHGGLLTQAAIMKVTANGTSTSPVIRGAWIMERLIGQPPLPPPKSVPAVEPDICGANTIRELLALHTKSESCAGCHARFDPVGLALENFEPDGYRVRDLVHGLVQSRIILGKEISR